jgi:hypothetical protein
MWDKWVEVRRIFGDPHPPAKVWERQFDYFDEELRWLCTTPWAQIDLSDLWYYCHDLAFVELQPEVFRYLFPVCLVAWHDSLMENLPCAFGDAEFHFAVHRGHIFDKMLTPEQRSSIFDYFKDCFLLRLDQERGFMYGASQTPAYGWMCRFNSMGIVMPRIDMLWQAWWTLDTPGRAVAAVEYISGLMYPSGHNPLFPAWTQEHGGGDPPLIGHDSLIVDTGWMAENTAFLREVLTVDFLRDALRRAGQVLRPEPEHEMTMQIGLDFDNHLGLVQARVYELPDLLTRFDSQFTDVAV